MLPVMISCPPNLKYLVVQFWGKREHLTPSMSAR